MSSRASKTPIPSPVSEFRTDTNDANPSTALSTTPSSARQKINPAAYKTFTTENNKIKQETTMSPETMQTANKEIAFIDPSVDDVDVFLAGLRPEVEAIILNESESALTQMSRALCERAPVSTLHIVSHGRPGEVVFSSGVLGLGNLAKYTHEMRTLGMQLPGDAQVNIWSCETAAGSAGATFVDSISELLGVKVAAADKLVGHESLGGDWVITEPGDMSRSILTSEGQGAYKGILVAPTIGAGAETGQLWASADNGWSGMEHAVWFFQNISEEPGNTWHSATRVIQIDTTGNYTFTANVDNYGRIFVDDNAVHNGDHFAGNASVQSWTLELNAGTHILEIQGQNAESGGAAGFSLRITDSGSNEVWNLKDHLAIDASEASYTENDQPTAVAPDLLVEDADSTELVGATISISQNYESGEDVLGFTDTSNISGSWDSAQGTLTLSGTATLAEYQAALRSVTYVNSSDNPNTQDRQISFQVDDGTASDNLSQVFNTTISVTPVNDVPVMSGDLAATVDEGGAIVLTTSDLNYTDADDDASGVTFTVSSLTNGRILVEGSEATSFSGQQIVDGDVSFEHDGSETTSASFSVMVEDGNEDSSTPAASTFDLTVTPVNDAPVMSGDLAATVDEGGAIVLTTSDLNYTDADDDASGVTFTVSSLTNGRILVEGSEATSFSGQQIVDGDVSFEHDGSETTSASFSVMVEDGNEDSSTPAASTFDLTVTPVNDAPDITTTQNPTILVEEGTGNYKVDDGNGNLIDSNASEIIDIDATDADGESPSFAFVLTDDQGVESLSAISANGRFSIDASTGVVSVVAGVLFDYEQDTSHDITVRATDPQGAYDEQTYTISVADVQNENLTLAPPQNYFVGGAFDDEFTYNVTDNHQGLVVVDGTEPNGIDNDTLTINYNGNADPANGNPSTASLYQDENGDYWVDIDVNGDGMPDIRVRDVEDLVLNLQGGNDHLVITGDLSLAGVDQNTIIVNGGPGDDLIDGGGVINVSQILNGQGGDDTLIGGGADDILDGGDDIDTADYSAQTAGLDINLTSGVAGGPSSPVGTDTLIDIENVIGGSGDDAINGNASDNLLEGRGGDDTIYGRDGNDILEGGAGNDELFGGSGEDVLRGGEGADFIDGGSGNDEIHGDAGNDIIDGGAGDDLIWTGAGTGSVDGSDGFDVVYFDGHVSYAGGIANQDNEELDIQNLSDPSPVSYQIELKNVENIVFTNGTNTTADDQVFQVINGNAVILTEADTGAVVENDTLTVDAANGVLSNDIELEDDEAKTVVGVETGDTTAAAAASGNVASGLAGAHGTLTLNADGSYSYEATDDSLSEGQVVTDVFTYTVTDGQNPVKETLTITVTGTNDQPVISAITASGAVSEVAGTSAGIDPVSTSGTITVSDPDDLDEVTLAATSNNDLVWSGGVITDDQMTAAQITSLISGFSISNTGPIAIDDTTNTASSGWSYTTNQDLNFLADGETLTFSYDVVVTDDSGAANNQSLAQTVTITITGTNDQPVVSLDTSATLTEKTGTGTGTNELSDTGSITISDRDDTDEVTLSSSFNDDVVWSGGTASDELTAAQIQNLADGFVLDNMAALAIADDTNSVSSGWTFSTSEDLNFLAAGETLTFSFDVMATDDSGAANEDSAAQTVTITITGTNDAPVITTTTGSDVEQTISEAMEWVSDGPRGNAGDLVAQGTLAFDDPDATDTHTASVIGAVIDGTLPPSIGGAAPYTLSSEAYAGFLSLFDENGPSAPVDVSEANGIQWAFNADERYFDYLANGESVEITYTVEVSDGALTDTQTVTITVTGQNDAPEITTVSGAPVHRELDDVQEESANDPTLNAGPLTDSGTLRVFDVDMSDNLLTAVLSVSMSGELPPGVPDTGWGYSETQGVYHSLVSVALNDLPDITTSAYPFNVLSLQEIVWNFSADETLFDYLADGESVDLEYTIGVRDDSGAINNKDSETIRITIRGANDGPVISVEGTDSDSAAFTEGDAGLSTDGTLTVQDVDLSDTVTATVAGVTESGTFGGTHPLSNAQLEAMLSVTSGAIDADLGDQGNIVWNFNSGTEAFDFLAAGETLVLTYTVQVQDDSGESNNTHSHDVTITITGTNDEPVITVGSGDADEETLQETNAALYTGGTLTVQDADLSDTVDPIVSKVWISGNQGTLTNTVLEAMMSVGPQDIAADPGDANNLHWAFDSGSETFDYLALGESLELMFEIKVEDSQGQLSDRQYITIVIEGTNDQPVISVASGEDALTLFDVAELGDQRTDDDLFGATSDSPDLSNAATDLSGTFQVEDLDVSNVVTASVAQVQIDGQINTTSAVSAAVVLAADSGHSLFDLFSLLDVTSPVIDSTDTTGDLTWTFSGKEYGFDYLDDGEALQLTYTIEVDDGSGAPNAIAAHNVVVTIIGTNDSPDVVADHFTVYENSYGEFNVITPHNAPADVDPEDHDFAVVSVQDLGDTLPDGSTGSDGAVIAVANGSNDIPTRFNTDLGAEVAIEPNGELTYYVNQPGNGHIFDQLLEGQTLDDTFTYTVRDEKGAESTATVTITLVGVNDAVKAVDDVINTDTHPAGNLTDNDTDADLGDHMTVTGVSWVAGGNIAGISQNFSNGSYIVAFTNGLVVTVGQDGAYTINSDAVTQSNVEGAFKYTVTDDYGASSTARVIISANGVNDPAVITGDNTGAVVEDQILSITGELSVADPDYGEAGLQAVPAGTSGDNGYGSFEVLSNGDWTYTLNNAATSVQALDLGDIVTDTITVTSIDGGTTETITVTITGTNDGPELSLAGSVAGVAENDSDLAAAVATLTVVDADADDTATFTISLGNDSGLFEIDETSGVITLARVPDDADVGQHTLQIMVEDSHGAVDTLNLQIPVSNVNDAPVAVVDVASTVEDNPISVPLANLIANDSDADGDALSITDVSVDSAAGTVAIAAGNVVYTPAANFNGVAVVSYTLSDGSLTTIGALQITVNPVNDAPSDIALAASAVQENAEGAVVGDVTVTDPDGDTVFTYTVNDERFEIVNGQLKLKDGISVDADTTGGSVDVTVTATDAGGKSLSEDFTVEVTDVNEDPVFSSDPLQLSTQEDTEMTGSVAYASDPDGDALSYSSSGTSAEGGVVVVGTDGSLSYTPAEDFSGSDSFEVTVSDGKGGVDTLTVLMTVDPINDHPEVAAAIEAVGNEDDASFVVDLLNGASDADGDTLSVVLDAGVTLPDYATLVGNEVVIDLSVEAIQGMANGQQTSFSLSYVIDDGNHGEVAQTATITITGTNDDPVVEAELSLSLVEDGDVVSIDLLQGASDIEGDTLSVVIPDALPDGVTLSGSVLTIDPTAEVFQPLAAGELAEESIQYQIIDNEGGSYTQTLNISATGVNDSPEAGGALATTGAEDGGIVSIELLNGVSDVDGDELTITLNEPVPEGFSLATDGHTLLVDTGNAAFQSLADGEQQTFEVSYTATDPSGASVQQTASITLTGNNDAVVNVAIIRSLTEDDLPLTINLLEGSTDPEGGDLTIQNLATVPPGDSVGGVTLGDGSLTVDPSSYQGLTTGESDTVNYTYDVVDDQGVATTQTLTITIEGVNDAPTVDQGIANQEAALSEAFEFDVLADAFNDVDISDSLTLTATLVNGAPLPAWLSFDGLTFSGTPEEGDGTLEVRVTATDEGNLQAYADFIINVEGANGAPVVTELDTQYIDEDSTATFDVLANASDPDGDPMQVINVTAFPGSAVVNAQGQIEYTPMQDYAGEVLVGYQVSDGVNTSGLLTFTIVIEAVNDAPVFSVASTSYEAIEDETLSGNLPGVVDPDSGDVLTYSVSDANPATGLVTFGTDGSFVYIPQPDFNGADTFTVVVTDGAGETSEVEVTVNVAAVDDAPVVGAGIEDVTVGEDGVVDVVIPDGTFTDPDGDELTYTATLAGGDPLPDWLEFDAETGTFSGDASGADADDYEIVVSATDGTTTVTDSFIITVPNYNDAPVVVDDTASASAIGGVINGNVLTNDSDPDAGDILTVSNTGVQVGAYGVLVVDSDGNYSYLVTDKSLVAGDSFDDVFTINVTDNVVEEPLQSTLTITVTGTNDAPIISSARSDFTVLQSAAILTGAIVFTDLDAGDSHAVATDAGIGDFDGDGDVDFSDAVLMWPHINQSYDGQFDLNDDGFVNKDDVDIFKTVFGQPSGATVTYAEDGSETALPEAVNVNALKLALTLNDDGSWAFDTTGMNLSFLGENAQIDVTYDITVEDAAGEIDSAQLTITLSGNAEGGVDMDASVTTNDVANEVTGTSGADILQGSAGEDVFTGGAGDDLFIYQLLDGADTITDFTPGSDQLLLQGLVASAQDALDLAGVDGSDVVFDFGQGDVVTLQDVSLASLTSDDFLIQ